MMPGLIDHIALNSGLRFTDAASGESRTFDQLNFFDSYLECKSKKIIFLYIDNSLEGITAFFSSWKSEHAVALIPPTLNIKLKNELEAIYLPGLIIDKTENSRPDYDSVYNSGTYAIFKKRVQTENYVHPKLKLLLSTSGTTGSPRFVKLTENNLVENAISILDYLPVQGNDVCPLNLPVYYSYGLSILTTNCISGGNVVCTNRDILSRDFWEDFSQFNYSSLAGVPFVYEMLYRTGFTKKNFPSLRYLTQAGGKLSKNMVDIFLSYSHERNIPFFVMYGQTEATARMSWMPPEKLKLKTESIGVPILNGKFSIEKETSELLYSGPNVFSGYLENPDGLSVMESVEWLHTGDQARMDDEGFYYITGRLKRMIKLFGNRVNLDEAENMLKTDLQIPTLACCGLQDKFLLVFETAPVQAGKQKITDYLFRNLGLHPTAVRYFSIDKMPLTQNGKPDYKKLVSEYADQ